MVLCAWIYINKATIHKSCIFTDHKLLVYYTFAAFTCQKAYAKYMHSWHKIIEGIGKSICSSSKCSKISDVLSTPIP